MISDTNEGWRR